MELYETQQEAIEAAKRISSEQIPAEFPNLFDPDLDLDEHHRKVNAHRSVFYYDGEYSPHHGKYEVKCGEMATFGLAAVRIGTAEFGEFHRLEHDGTAEMARKMMGLM
jgi:hypothetical protein